MCFFRLHLRRFLSLSNITLSVVHSVGRQFMVQMHIYALKLSQKLHKVICWPLGFFSSCIIHRHFEIAVFLVGWIHKECSFYLSTFFLLMAKQIFVDISLLTEYNGSHDKWMNKHFASSKWRNSMRNCNICYDCQSIFIETVKHTVGKCLTF